MYMLPSVMQHFVYFGSLSQHSVYLVGEVQSKEVSNGEGIITVCGKLVGKEGEV